MKFSFLFLVLIIHNREKLEMFSAMSTKEKYDYLVKCSNAYYETGHPLIDDATFDSYASAYEKESGKPFQYLGRSNNKKIKLPVYMGSLDKAKTDKELSSFLQRLTNKKIAYSKLVCSMKLDGCSLLLFPDEKGKIKCTTRGDGIYGSDVSAILPYISLPKAYLQSSSKEIIRGELLVKKGDTSRNIVSGILNSKELDIQGLKQCYFLAYNIPSKNGKYTPKQMFEELHTLGFTTPYIGCIEKEKCTEKDCSLLLQSAKSTSSFDLDGIVIQADAIYKEESNKNPLCSIAFKKNAQAIQTTVVDVLWEESRYGVLYPRVKVNPIMWEGVQITFASGKNAKFIQENKIGPGTIVSICRSGDVIPDIVSVIQPTEAKFPDVEYEWTESVHISAKRKSENTPLQIAHFISICGGKGVKEAIIDKCNIKSIHHLMTVTKEELLACDGIKDKSADKILEQITIVKQNCTLVHIMLGSCIFEHFGEKKCTSIVQAIPNLEQLACDGDTRVDIEKWKQLLATISIKTQADDFIVSWKEFVKKYSTFCKQYLVKNSKQPITSKVVGTVCSGWNVVFTGCRDAELKEKIESLGGKCTDSVSKSTTHLIIKDATFTSSKTEKARENNISILTLQECKARLG